MKQILWAHEDYADDLAEELRLKNATVLARREHRFFIESDRRDWTWSETAALNAEILKFDSISKAQDLLRARGKLWTPSPLANFRRSELIAQDLLQPKHRKRKFLEKIPGGSLGVFCLTEENEMWVSPELSPAVPPEDWQFEEDSEAPSRAYLKLWELFTREGFKPKAGETCLELGSAPGGWTWVLAKLGCSVIAVDKGEMDPKILALPKVKWKRQDAFTLNAEEIGPVDWLFSDLICFPSRLLELVQEWSDKGLAKRFVCTLKFKGSTDFQAMDQFLKFPGSKAMHLHHNKHEVTWIWIPESNVPKLSNS